MAFHTLMAFIVYYIVSWSPELGLYSKEDARPDQAQSLTKYMLCE